MSYPSKQRVIGNGLKVGIMIDRFDPGAVAKIAIEEVRHLGKMGIDAHLLVLMEDRSSEYRYNDIRSELPVDSLSRKLPSPFQRSMKFPFFTFFSSGHLTCALVTPRYLSRQDYDIVVAHGTYTCFTAHQLWKRRRIPYVAYIHDPISYILPRAYSNSTSWRFMRRFVPLGRLLDRAIIENSTFTVANSDHTRKRISELSPSVPTGVVYPGCSPLDNLPDNRGNYALAVTKWDHSKRPEFLLDPLAQTKLKMKVVGFWVGANLKPSFLAEVFRRGLKDQVFVFDAVGEEELRTLYSSARCLIHPIREAYGMTALEAASCGSPFIIPRGSGVGEIFQDGLQGFFPAEGDLEAFSKCLSLLALDERAAWRMGVEAWRVSKRHTWTDHAEALASILSKLN